MLARLIALMCVAAVVYVTTVNALAKRFFTEGLTQPPARADH